LSSSSGFYGSQRGRFIAFFMVVFLLVSFEPMAIAEVSTHRIPKPDGFMAPTLEGPWRTNFSLFAWAPTTVKFKVDSGESTTTIDKGLGWLTDVLDYEIPIEAEVRKGSFGAYAHLLAFKLSDTIQEDNITLDYVDKGYLLDLGISYELGHWALGKGVGAPMLTLEPFAGIRYLYDPVDVTVSSGPLEDDETIKLTNTVPVFGLRTFVDLSEQWNLRFDGDYGGFGVDDNHETWNLRTLAGYRFRASGVGWNIQAGYRWLRVMDYRKDAADLTIDIRGPIALFTVEF
jgi:hypothetical protein